MTFFFYDLETSGFDPKTARIMQFAGIRTNDKLEPIGEPVNELIKLTPDILPEPEAILITGITPQKTLEDGYTEAEFLRIFADKVLQPDTVIAGFNTIRFDDEFMRYLLYRNFYDAYEWQWQDGRSRWDILDLSRMVRALRPEGIEWPSDSDGKPTNRLEALTIANSLEHSEAHDALSDVKATIAVAKLLKDNQSKLFEYLLENRGKNEARKLLDPENPVPVVYSSGSLSSDYLKTSVVIPVAPDPANQNGVIVWDLRFDPTEYADLSVDQLKERRFMRRDELKEKQLDRLPAKSVSLNKSPALAPLGVLDEASQKRIKLDIKTVEGNLKKLAGIKDFATRLHQTFELKDERKSWPDVDGQLYDSFLSDKDRNLLQQIRNQDATALADFNPSFIDERLPKLLLRYKARNYPESLTEAERAIWEAYRLKRLSGELPGMSLPKYFDRLQKMASHATSERDQFILEELQLYAQSLAPEDL